MLDMQTYMPAEWTPHERTWMAWPSAGYTLGDTEELANEARECWANVAHAISRFEPVTMVVDPSDVEVAKTWLNPEIDIVEAPLDDAWMRDIGPTFVVDETGKLCAVNWVFNGWGAQSWASWEHDALIASRVAHHEEVPLINSPMVNEGGGIHVNGEGTVMVTETVQLDTGRNPGWTKQQVETELQRTLGVSRVIWVPRGLTRDYDEFGTRGHIDIVACFSDEKTVLVHDQLNQEHPDYWISQEVKRVLEEYPDLTVVSVPAPEVLEDDEGWVDYSYINHYVCNGGVILCAFNDPVDGKAKKILEKAYPGREVVLVDARPLFARGGGIHCITQQQPAV